MRDKDSKPDTSEYKYYFDFAGIEGVEWPILWPINFIILLISYYALKYAINRYGFNYSRTKYDTVKKKK